MPLVSAAHLIWLLYSNSSSTSWSVLSHSLCCAGLCNCPPEPDNGYLRTCYQIPGSQETGDSHVVDYHCHVGYFLDGVSTRTCQRNGTWSGTAPVCLRSEFVNSVL